MQKLDDFLNRELIKDLAGELVFSHGIGTFAPEDIPEEALAFTDTDGEVIIEGFTHEGRYWITRIETNLYPEKRDPLVGPPTGRHYDMLLVDDPIIGSKVLTKQGQADLIRWAAINLKGEHIMNTNVSFQFIDGFILVNIGCTKRIVRSKSAMRRAVVEELEKEIYPRFFDIKGKPKPFRRDPENTRPMTTEEENRYRREEFLASAPQVGEIIDDSAKNPGEARYPTVEELAQEREQLAKTQMRIEDAEDKPES